MLPTVKTIVVWLVAGLWAAGLVAGFLPVHDAEGTSCGSGFAYGGGDSTYDDPQPQPESCVHPREQARQLPIALLVVGSGLGLSLVPWQRARRSTWQKWDPSDDVV